MKDEYKLEATMHMDDGERGRIEREMSRAMGRRIKEIGITDMSKMSKDDWASIVSCAFDACAPKIFLQRIYVSPPQLTDDEVPF